MCFVFVDWTKIHLVTMQNSWVLSDICFTARVTSNITLFGSIRNCTVSEALLIEIDSCSKYFNKIIQSKYLLSMRATTAHQKEISYHSKSRFSQSHPCFYWHIFRTGFLIEHKGIGSLLSEKMVFTTSTLQ